MKSFEYSGVWWIPENPDKKVAGFVTFSQENGVELKLIGALDTFESRKRLNNHQIIFGITINGKEVTLYDCYMLRRTSSRVTSLPFSDSYDLSVSCEFEVQVAYFNAHLSTEEMFNFNKVRVIYTHLADWVTTTSGLNFNLEIEQSDSNIDLVGYTIPEDIRFETTKGNIILGFSNSSLMDTHKYAIEEKLWIEVSKFGDKTLDKIKKEFVYPIGNLISFLTDKFNYIEELYLYSKEFYRETGDFKVSKPIQVFYQQTFYQSSKSLHPMDMILYYEQIANDLPIIFENWLKSAEELDAVFNSYFWVQGANELNSVERFLILVRAIEVYHRRRKNNEVLSKVEHKKKKEEILSSVPDNHKEWLKEKLLHTNEPTLKNRLKDLIKESEELISPLIRDTDKFIKFVGDSRNYYTHYGDALKNKAAKDIELIELSEKLIFLLKSCIFNDIGINIEKQMAIFSNNRKYLLAKRANKNV